MNLVEKAKYQIKVGVLYLSNAEIKELCQAVVDVAGILEDSKTRSNDWEDRAYHWLSRYAGEEKKK